MQNKIIHIICKNTASYTERKQISNLYQQTNTN